MLEFSIFYLHTFSNKSSLLTDFMLRSAHKLLPFRGTPCDLLTQILNIINQLHKGCLSDSVPIWKNKRERNLNPPD